MHKRSHDLVRLTRIGSTSDTQSVGKRTERDGAGFRPVSKPIRPSEQTLRGLLKVYKQTHSTRIA